MQRASVVLPEPGLADEREALVALHREVDVEQRLARRRSSAFSVR